MIPTTSFHRQTWGTFESLPPFLLNIKNGIVNDTIDFGHGVQQTSTTDTDYGLASQGGVFGVLGEICLDHAMSA